LFNFFKERERKECDKYQIFQEQKSNKTKTTAPTTANISITNKTTTLISSSNYIIRLSTKQQ